MGERALRGFGVPLVVPGPQLHPEVPSFFRINNFSILRYLDISEDPTFIPVVAAEGKTDSSGLGNVSEILQELLETRQAGGPGKRGEVVPGARNVFLFEEQRKSCVCVSGGGMCFWAAEGNLGLLEGSVASARLSRCLSRSSLRRCLKTAFWVPVRWV